MGCLVIVVIILFLQVRGLIGPIRTVFLLAPKPVIVGARSVARPVGDFFNTILTLRRITGENSELLAKVAQLEQDNVLLNEYRLENDALKNELGFVHKSPYHLQPCSVLAVDPQQLTATMVIDCGQGQGLQVGQAVISQNYLVGKVIAVGNSTSTVLLITHTRSSVDARVSKNATEAIVRGSSGAGLVLDQVPQDTDLQKGDLIVTAGINSLVPKNILIGAVGEILSKPSDLFKQSSVTSPINFQSLQFVFIVSR
jgi:rod shape-determining protein MreC